MASTYLSAPMKWSEIRERYPSQEVHVENPRGTWRSFTYAQVVLDSETHSPLLIGPGMTVDTRDTDPDPTMEVRSRLPRFTIDWEREAIDPSPGFSAKLSPENQARLARLEASYSRTPPEGTPASGGAGASAPPLPSSTGSAVPTGTGTPG